MRIKSVLSVLFLLLCFTSQASIDNLMPKPQSVERSNGGDFAVQNVQLKMDENLQGIFTEWIQNECGGTVSGGAGNQIVVEKVASVDGAEFQDEAYNLDVTASKITIKCTTRTGAVWALQTLAQLADGANIPSVKITDWPAFRIRGYMHDVGRSFIDFDELKKEIKFLARFKINIFHWHLSENQAWRLESKIYPALNRAENHTRFPGKYYTIEQAKELVSLCNEYGMTVIPELDMPGHSECFERALGIPMQSEEGLAAVKKLLTEACSTFEGTPWMHIGTDEVAITMDSFVPDVLAHLRSLNRKVGTWSPGYKYKEDNHPDLYQLWGALAPPIKGCMNVDSRNHYLNHYDMFADIAGIYTSNILGVQKQTPEFAGAIAAVWNDRALPTQKDIIIQNQFYAAVLAIGERAWRGGGDQYITERGTNVPSPGTKEFKEFVDWERRFLFWKESYLKDEPIAYVKQTHVKWRITDSFPNGGVLNTSFAPEDSLATSYQVDGKKYNTRMAVGSGVILRHFWGELVCPAFYPSPQFNSTAYAYTWVYSPVAQEVGTWIETQNYGRADTDLPAPAGKWDYKDSRVWINDVAIEPPVWEGKHTEFSNEVYLTNENFTARPPIKVNLKQGWNKVLLRLPIGAFKGTEVKRNKWMFAFAFVTLDGKKEIDNIIWSPDCQMNPLKDNLKMVVGDAENIRLKVKVGNAMGEYPVESVIAFDKQLTDARKKLLQEPITDDELVTAAEKLTEEMNRLKKSVCTFESSFIVSDDVNQVYYKLFTPKRGNKCLTFKGAGATLYGEVWNDAKADDMLWKLIRLADGSFGLINKNSNNGESYYIHNVPNTKREIQALSGTPTEGWKFSPASVDGLVIIFSGTVQINQTAGGAIYNYGGGTNIKDIGCMYKLEIVSSTLPQDENQPLKDAIAKAMNLANGVLIGQQPGEYPKQAQTNLQEATGIAMALLDATLTQEQMDAAVLDLNKAIDAFKASLTLPLASSSTRNYWYSLHTPNRGSLYVTSKGENANLIGEMKVMDQDIPLAAQLWKLVPLQDGSYSLVNKETESYISPIADASTPLKTVAGKQESKGWQLTPTGTLNYFIITSSTAQFNQQNEPFAVLNWGSGTNTSDTGCQYVVTLESQEDKGSSSAAESVTKKFIWLDNGIIHSVGISEPIELYTTNGVRISPKSELPKGVIVARAGTFVQRLVVR